ncbi:MAG TPA: serine O-acetyltransferase [Limnochordia bacterium]|nr:serine O-acetyltransferase [Limnochordia bacterium]
MFRAIRQDVRAVFERDPAARSRLEVICCYPGLHAVWLHRVAHWLYRRGWRFWARLVSQRARSLTGIEIHPGAKLGTGVFIDHGMGVVIGETAEVADDVTLYQGVVLGGTGKEKGKRHPTVGRGAVLGAGSILLGAIHVGEFSRIGAGAVVIDDVPAHATVVGIPGRVVRRRGVAVARVDLNHADVPDPLERLLRDMNDRIGVLEAELAELRGHKRRAAGCDGD